MTRSEPVALVAAAAVAGWTWPVLVPVAIALVVLPLAFAALTPSRHVVGAWRASARAFVTTAASALGVSAMFVGWPDTLRLASALAAAAHGVALPASLAAWARARRRLARVPAVVPWLLLAGVIAGALVTGR